MIKKIVDVYEALKSILPSTYLTPSLAFFENEAALIKNTKIKGVKQNESLYAVVDPETLTINLPLSIQITYVNSKNQEHTKTVQFNKLESEEIALVLAHELGHIYYGERYGYDHPKYLDEKLMDIFALRWVKKMKKKKLL